jgi:hypothetical protein
MPKRLHLVLIPLLFLVPLVAAPACKHFSPDSPLAQKIIDCGSKAIRERGLSYVGKVNDVLADTRLSDQQANGRLINLGLDAGQDVIGCLLFEQGARFAESAKANPGDVASARARERASARIGELEAEGYRFEQAQPPQ